MKLQVTSCKSQVASHKLQVTSCKLQVASCKLQVTSCKLQGERCKTWLRRVVISRTETEDTDRTKDTENAVKLLHHEILKLGASKASALLPFFKKIFKKNLSNICKIAQTVSYYFIRKSNNIY